MKWGQPGPFEIIETEAFVSSGTPAQAEPASVSSVPSVPFPAVHQSAEPEFSAQVSPLANRPIASRPGASSKSAASNVAPLSFATSTSAAHEIDKTETNPSPNSPSPYLAPLTIFRKAVLSACPSSGSKTAMAENVSSSSSPQAPQNLQTRNPFTAVEAPVEAPRRRYDCQNYCTCLDLAAALNWDNFTCRGCSGEIDEKLLWRARQALRKDEIARQVCDLPSIGISHKEANSPCNVTRGKGNSTQATSRESCREVGTAQTLASNSTQDSTSTPPCSKTAEGKNSPAKSNSSKGHPAGLSLATKR